MKHRRHLSQTCRPRNSHANILWAFQEYLGAGSVLEAELQGIWKCLWYCKENEWNNICVESDSLTAITMILQTRKSWNWKLVNIPYRINALRSEMTITFGHHYREANRVADWLATDALENHVIKGYCGQGLPIPARKLAYQDKISTTNVRYG